MTIQRTHTVRYGLAVVSVVIAVSLRLSLSQLLQHRIPFILPFCAVVVTSWFGGRGPGALAVVLATVGSWYFIVPPALSFVVTPGAAFQIAAFIFIGSLTAYLTGSLRMAHDAIQDREAQLRFMASAMPEILFASDGSGRIANLSERFTEYTGKTLSELTDYGWMDLVHPDETGAVVDSWKHSIARNTEFRSTCRIRDRHGSYRWFQCRAVPMHDKLQRIIRWFGVCADIDDHKRLEDALAQSNVDLQRFAFAASHDLQEPLRVIGIFTELLIRNRAKGEDSEHLSGEIRRGIRRMQALIDACLDYSRISSDSANTKNRISLEEPLSDAIWSLQAAIEESGATIKHDGLPMVFGDARLISRVFQNLLGNAIKFRSETPLAITVAARQEGAICVVSVSDNGIGMSMQHAEAAFEAFKRLHSSSRYPGSGLGLASVKRIVELHHGSVWVESEPGKGSTFFFTLQLQPSRAVDFDSSSAA